MAALRGLYGSTATPGISSPGPGLAAATAQPHLLRDLGGEVSRFARRGSARS
ncbi:MAG: hypothetical protein U0800_17745 [Isosphaeraceae bacterium]